MTDAELDRLVLENCFQWKWVQAPKYDYDGPLPDQGKVLVPPDFDEDTYQWPPKGIVSPGAFASSRRFCTSPADNEQLLAKMESEGWLTEMQQGRRSDGSPSEWMVSFWIHPQHGYAEDRSRLRAVVKAALLAKAVPLD